MFGPDLLPPLVVRGLSSFLDPSGLKVRSPCIRGPHRATPIRDSNGVGVRTGRVQTRGCSRTRLCVYQDRPCAARIGLGGNMVPYVSGEGLGDRGRTFWDRGGNRVGQKGQFQTPRVRRLRPFNVERCVHSVWTLTPRQKRNLDLRTRTRSSRNSSSLKRRDRPNRNRVRTDFRPPPEEPPDKSSSVVSLPLTDRTRRVGIVKSLRSVGLVRGKRVEGGRSCDRELPSPGLTK